MFLDASAIVALISKEPEAELLAEKLTTRARHFASPTAIWKATIALAREGNGFTFEEAKSHVESFVARLRV